MTTIATIIDTVAAYYELTPALLCGPDRRRRFARPRQIAMFIAREATAKSLPQIAIAFGARHHTTAMASVRHIQALLLRDDDVARDVTVLRARLPATVVAIIPVPAVPWVCTHCLCKTIGFCCWSCGRAA